MPRVNSIEKWAKFKEDYHLRFKCSSPRPLPHPCPHPHPPTPAPPPSPPKQHAPPPVQVLAQGALRHAPLGHPGADRHLLHDPRFFGAPTLHAAHRPDPTDPTTQRPLHTDPPPKLQPPPPPPRCTHPPPAAETAPPPIRDLPAAPVLTPPLPPTADPKGKGKRQRHKVLWLIGRWSGGCTREPARTRHRGRSTRLTFGVRVHYFHSNPTARVHAARGLVIRSV